MVVMVVMVEVMVTTMVANTCVCFIEAADVRDTRRELRQREMMHTCTIWGEEGEGKGDR